ncbi:MAG: pilus assembly protein [Burkholderiales bacterium]
MAPPHAFAALTDLADAPLASSSGTTVKPNLLFTLDDSGSMAWGFMPDDRENWTGYVGFKNHLCNTMYYNPNISYVPPKNADGTNFASMSFTEARDNGFDSSSSTVNLNTSFQAYNNTTSSGNGSDTAQPAYYYKFNGSGTPTTSQCREGSSSAFPHSSASFTKVRVSSTSGPGNSDERTNFANWYSYYRTRLLMVKSATGRAFANLTSAYRVGFITINPNNPVTSSKYLPIADFDVTQKANWYAKLYSQTTNGGTPLREALARAGRHFAGRQDGINSGMSGDPMQYSCQQNFTLLTTDGYWNGNAGVQLDGSTPIGNHDGVLNADSPRPMFDGSVSTTTTTTNVDTESYSTSGCSSGRQKIVRSRNTTTTTVGSDGSSTTTTSSSVSTVESCSRNPRALQNPNPSTTTTTSTSTSGGSSGSLADVAQYYYITDLRPNGSIGALGTDVGTGGPGKDVPSTGTGPEDDKNPLQHMTTFTMGLGLAGTLNYQANYKTGAGDFAALRSGALNWPVPSAGNATALDDLWHAAVNGRGQFFSAADPDSVVSSLSAALAGVNARVASAAAAATSNLEPVAGDNFAYTASYTTVSWTGELQAREINLTTGAVNSTAVWSAQAKLDAKTRNFCDNRTIKLFRSGATGNLADFTWNTYACDGSGNPAGSASTGLNAEEQANFGTTQVAQLSHYPAMTDGTGGTVNQRSLAAGATMLNFLRGQRGNEGFTVNDANALFRSREHVLGDIVGAQPVFVKAPFANYTDAGYAAFKSANASRTPMVYVAANDGMLHAFYAGSSASDPLGGEERWAFVPTMSLPNLYKLANNNYSNLHQFYVDGTPVVGDIYDASAAAWKTILVGGLNRGGRGFYALDITDPANPKGLWEFKHGASCYPASTTSDCHLGYSYGNPIISKLADGRWVVFVTSGYNNVNSPAISGDGAGYLYVLNAATGEIIYKIGTGYGDSATPSGLGKINNFVNDTATDNTTQRVYGVDLAGNIWRFEVNATQSATLLGVAKDPGGNRQPITVKPLLAETGSPPSPFVYVATGRYLGASDLAAAQVQTVYAIKDPLSASPIADLRASSRTQTITTAGATRNVTCTSGCSSTSGWFADLPESRERVNIDMKLELGTLTVASNVPEDTPCSIGGHSWINYFDARSGDVVPGATSLGGRLSESLAVGLNIVRLPDGRVVVISTTSDAKQFTSEVPVAPPAPSGKRISWRELVY